MERDGWDELDDFENAYRNWICDTMDARHHRILLDVMYDTPFRWKDSIPRDADREADGRFLRKRFCDETGMRAPSIWFGTSWPASFLEVLVALAYSIEDSIMYDPEKGDRTSTWFWEMLANADLDGFDDEKMLKDGMCAYYYVCEIEGKIMDRRYERNGQGGLFPLRKPAMDQRDVEIWYQANAYMIEKEGL
jgi:hypothetical protein